MKFLLDSCIAKFAVTALRQAGFETYWVPEGGADPGDSLILQKALDEELTLVTADKDFGDLVFVFKRSHPCIIRLVDIPARLQGEFLLAVIKTHSEDIKRNALITVTQNRIRVRDAGL